MTSNTFVSVQELIKTGKVIKRKEVYALPLSKDMVGQINIDEYFCLFQFVPQLEKKDVLPQSTEVIGKPRGFKRRERVLGKRRGFVWHLLKIGFAIFVFLIFSTIASIIKHLQ